MYYFISDIHLGFYERHKDKEREEILIKLLERISLDAKEIFFVGDIFDYWFEYNTVIPKYFYRTLTKIYELRQKEIPIHYIMGNHDFGHKNFFKNEFGIEIEREDIERELHGKKFFISHGDGKGKGDTGYKILKKILRSPISNWLFRIFHPDFGISLASGSSQKSRVYTDKRDFGPNDRMKVFAKEKIEEGFDYVILGHRHKAEVLNHNDGIYINLGEWFKHPKVGIWDGKEFKLEDVSEFLDEK